jgi:hypothetical protein
MSTATTVAVTPRLPRSATVCSARARSSVKPTSTTNASAALASPRTIWV